MKRVCVITPHLSTGGLPAYLVYQIKRLLASGEWEVKLVEYENIAPVYDVQRRVLKGLLGDRLLDWPQGTEKQVVHDAIAQLLDEWKPDVVHMAEFPEEFFEAFGVVYKADREYKIVETSHSFDFDMTRKVTKPDGFIFVSDYQGLLYGSLGVEWWVDKYPIGRVDRPKREDALRELGLDPALMHVLHVGLFCERKRQDYVMQIARVLESWPVQFHFIGNMAGNFEGWWKPVVEQAPWNCCIYGERGDVDKFYQSMDLLVFPSQAELNPLVPREAIAHGMQVAMLDLPIYRHEFEGFSGVRFLSNRLLEDAMLVARQLGLGGLEAQVHKRRINLVHLLSQPNEARELESIGSLKEVKKYGVEYVQCVSPPNDEEPEQPPFTCLEGKHSRRYGLYKAFKGVLEEHISDDIEALVFCECDCVLNVSTKAFIDKIVELIKVSGKYNVDLFSLGPMVDYETGEKWSKGYEKLSGSDVVLVDRFIQTHCLVFPRRSFEYVLKKLEEAPWDVIDLWLNRAFGLGAEKRIGMLPHAMADQVSGVSLLEDRVKGVDIKGKHIGVEEVYEECKKQDGAGVEWFGKQHGFGVGSVPSFLDGPRVEVSAPPMVECKVEMIDQATGEVVHKDKLGNRGWTKAFRRWYTDWLIKVEEPLTGKKWQHRFELKNKRVLIQLCSKSLGDTIAWFPYVVEFQNKHECVVVCSTFWNGFFRGVYPELKFAEPGEVVHDLYAGYEVGCFDDDFSRNKNNWRVVPMQQIACDVLGLEYVELKPRIDVAGIEKLDLGGAYVCLSEHSTLQCKYWNYPGGWQYVVDKLNKQGIKCVVISKESTELKGVVDRTNRKMEETIGALLGAKGFVGVGSGLAWLAWALNVPVVMISGFSLPMCEMQRGVVRITNASGCTGCFNDPKFAFDRGNWFWCPNSKQYECSRNIEPEVVLEGIQKALVMQVR